MSGAKTKCLLIHASDNVGLSGGLGVCYKVVVSRGLGVACFLVILGLIDGVTQYEIDTMSLSNQIERTTLISPV